MKVKNTANQIFNIPEPKFQSPYTMLNMLEDKIMDKITPYHQFPNDVTEQWGFDTRNKIYRIACYFYQNEIYFPVR